MKNYSISLISGILLLMTGIAAFNWLMNPYDIFDSPNIEGLNQYKVEANKHTRLSKAYHVDTIRPDVIFLASSRGLVVPDSYFSNEGETALNMALASASTYELLRYFQHANATRPLKRVVLALDEGFTSGLQAGFSEDRLKVDGDGEVNRNKKNKKIRDWVNNLISLDAFKSSLRTIRKQKESPNNLSEEKYMEKRVAGAGGHRQMFRKMEASVFARNISHLNCSDRLYEGCNDEVRAKQYFEKIIEMAYQNKIKLIIYFSPIHARYLEVLNFQGKWGAYESMKRFVVETVASQAKLYGRHAFQIWDFSGYNDVTTEVLPDYEDTETLMSWYWEGSHYTNKTAELVFEKMFGENGTDIAFGKKIDSMNIDMHLMEMSDERNDYIEKNKAYFDELETISLLNKAQQ